VGSLVQVDVKALGGPNPSWAKKTNRDGALPASRKITARV
jgi:hypothetical protein